MSVPNKLQHLSQEQMVQHKRDVHGLGYVKLVESESLVWTG